MKKYWLRILLLSSLALTIALAQVWTQPKPPASPPGSPQASTPESQPDSNSPLIYGPYSQAEMINILQAASQAAAKVAAQAAVDKAVPLAVQAAVAQKEGELAAARALADWNKAEAQRQAVKAGLWRIAGLAGALGIVGALLAPKAWQGAAWGAGIGAASGAIWYVADHWPPWKIAIKN